MAGWVQTVGLAYFMFWVLIFTCYFNCFLFAEKVNLEFFEEFQKFFDPNI
jgi:hypothetical protein